jgi:hypothetical protein
MPLGTEEAQENQNPPVLPKHFKSGKHLDPNSLHDTNSLLVLVENLLGTDSVYYDDSNTTLLPSLAKLINKNVDFRSILFLMVTFSYSELAVDFIKYLENNKIFIPIDKRYEYNSRSQNFFTDVAALGDQAVTKRLFKHGMAGFTNQLSKSRAELSEEDKKDEINKFVEDVFAINPSGSNLSTIEYVIRSMSTVLLCNEGLFESKESSIELTNLAYGLSETAPVDIEVLYSLPWKTIEVLVNLAANYNIDLRKSLFEEAFQGQKIFDVIARIPKDESTIYQLANYFIYTYQNTENQKIEITPYGDEDSEDNDEFSFDLKLMPMHFVSSGPSNIKVIMSCETIKRQCALIAEQVVISNALEQKIESRIHRHSFILQGQNNQITKHGEKIEQHDKDIIDLKNAFKLIDKIVKTHLADEVIFETIGNDAFIRKFYIDVRDIVLKYLNNALKGAPDEQLALLYKNAQVVGGIADFAAGFAGVPGVVGAAFGVLIFASKYFAKINEQEVSADMKELLGPLNLPKLLAIGIAESLAIKARNNIEANPELKASLQSRQKDIIKCIDILVAEQLSQNNLKKIFETLKNMETDIFQTLKEILTATAIAGRPYITHQEPLKTRRSIIGFSKSHKSHHTTKAPANHELVKLLLNPPKLLLNDDESIGSTSPQSHASAGTSSSEIENKRPSSLRLQ